MHEGNSLTQSQPNDADPGDHPSNHSDLQFDHLPDVLTVVQAARVLRIGRHTLYEAVKRGEVPAIRVGRKILFNKSVLMRLWDSSR
jgi:excisionase family DNA binding protein